MTFSRISVLICILCATVAAADPAQPDALSDALPAWTVPGKFVTAIAVLGDQCYVGTSDHGLWAFHNGGWEAQTLPVDDIVTCLAFDASGRLWVGHGFHGVSVFNGTQWRSYDAPDGPIGHHVFRIAVSPRDGDVWMATDLGLARYSKASDRWTYITRAEGLPADQVAALAFDSDGTLYVGTQCDGVSIGSPADNFATWRVITGPTREPVFASGSGLPSMLVNDILPLSNGRVFVATDAGLAVSRDHGVNWSFVRGADYADKVLMRTGGPPQGWQPATAPLAEDDVASLTATQDGNLWLGYRHLGAGRFDAQQLLAIGSTITKPTSRPFVEGESVRAIAVTKWGTYAGTAGDGLVRLSTDAATAVAPLDLMPPFPQPATITPRRFDALQAALKSAAPQPLSAAYLGEDWVTRGDGAGRYGWQKMAFPFMGTGGWAENYDVHPTVGPHNTQGGPFYWFDTNDSSQERVLYVPNSFHRVQGEWNDGSFDKTLNPPAMEGPDLWLKITVPATGTHRLTLLFINYDGRTRANRFRDFLVEVKASTDQVDQADFAPALARTRVSDFYEPVYKQFLLAGGSAYWVKISRNHSHVAKVSAAFLDRMPSPDANGKDLDRLPFPLLDPDHWGPPPAPPAAVNDPVAAPFAVTSARELWDELDTRYSDAAAVPLQLLIRMQAYQLAATNGASAELLANWRWHLHLWNSDDRLEFCKEMDAGYQRTLASNPGIAEKPRMSMVEAYHKAHN